MLDPLTMLDRGTEQGSVVDAAHRTVAQKLKELFFWSSLPKHQGWPRGIMSQPNLLSCTSPLRTQSPMINLGQLLGLVPGHVLGRPQNVLKNPCPDLF